MVLSEIFDLWFLIPLEYEATGPTNTVDGIGFYYTKGYSNWSYGSIPTPAGSCYTRKESTWDVETEQEFPSCWSCYWASLC